MSRPINLIVIHCSDSPNGRPVTVEDIDRWHGERGFQRQEHWTDIQNPTLEHIGYHFVIGVNGALLTGRHLDEVGAHAQGYNQKSIGICVVGKDKFTQAQWDKLRENVSALLRKYEGVKVCGHRDLPNVHKACPNFDVETWLAEGMQPTRDKILEA